MTAFWLTGEWQSAAGGRHTYLLLLVIEASLPAILLRMPAGLLMWSWREVATSLANSRR